MKLWCDAQYPDPSKAQWIQHLNEELMQSRQQPDVWENDDIRLDWISRDMFAKFLGIFSSSRIYKIWLARLPNETAQKKAAWKEFVNTM